MSEVEKSSSQSSGSKTIFPDLAELWKELYFKTESAWAQACKEFVGTETFVKMLDQTLNQHLSIEKITRQNVDKLLEVSTSPSKKDLARIAELVISIEEKIDELDGQLIANINKMADSMMGIIKLLRDNQEQLAVIKNQNSKLQTQMNEMQAQNNDLMIRISTMNINVAEKFPDPNPLAANKEADRKISRRKKNLSSEPADEKQ